MSTLGKGATGNRKNAVKPDKASPIVSSVVATGRSMKTREKFMAQRSGRRRAATRRGAHESPASICRNRCR